ARRYRHEWQHHHPRRGASKDRARCHGPASVIQQMAIGLAEARIAVDAVLGSTRRNEAPLAVSVVDGDGNMLYQLRQDGASGDEDRDEQLALKGAEALAQLAVDEWRTRRDPRPIRERSRG